jgi:predicted NBD/HSP70 family sugar kinase
VSAALEATIMTSQRGLTVTETANSNLQNQINISIIFNYVRSHGVAYRAQIARDLGISAPAVSRAVDKLIRAGDLVESERVQVENGKKAAQISLNAARGIVVGVDILTDPIEISISDFAGNVLHSQKGPPVDEGSDLAEFLLAAIGDALAAFRAAPGRRRRRILAIGVGVPAAVDPRHGRILNASLYVNLDDSDFREKLRARYHAPVFVENISNLAAIGEWKRGVGRGSRNMVFIELSNGIGAGVILEGELYRGALGSAGEVGFSITHPGGLAHGDSRRGYLETVASLGALRERSRARYGARPGRDPIVPLCQAAGAGDGWASAVIHEAVGHLTVAIVNTLVVLNPELLVIGGSVCEFPEAVALIARPLITEVLRHYPFQPAQVLLTSLGARASVFGALQFALDSLLVRSYPYRFEIPARSRS